MHLEGSCHCGRVRFTVESSQPVPFMRCYCSICRKTAGSGGYAINLGADAGTLVVHGRRYLRVYQARLGEGEDAPVSEARTTRWSRPPTGPQGSPTASRSPSGCPCPAWSSGRRPGRSSARP